MIRAILLVELTAIPHLFKSLFLVVTFTTTWLYAVLPCVKPPRKWQRSYFKKVKTIA